VGNLKRQVEIEGSRRSWSATSRTTCGTPQRACWTKAPAVRPSRIGLKRPTADSHRRAPVPAKPPLRSGVRVPPNDCDAREIGTRLPFRTEAEPGVMADSTPVQAGRLITSGGRNDRHEARITTRLFRRSISHSAAQLPDGFIAW